jgi:hypothetical protein
MKSLKDNLIQYEYIPAMKEICLMGKYGLPKAIFTAESHVFTFEYCLDYNQSKKKLIVCEQLYFVMFENVGQIRPSLKRKMDEIQGI